MSCSLRDAAELEARGVPTVVLANDVFRPIAHATAALVGLPASYVDDTVVFLPHPTSMLTRPQITALIDERAGEIEASLLGRKAHGASNGAASAGNELDRAREALASLRESFRADGADLVVEGFADGVLDVRIAIEDEAACADGSCLLPAHALRPMLESVVRAGVPELREVRLSDPRLETVR